MNAPPLVIILLVLAVVLAPSTLIGGLSAWGVSFIIYLIVYGRELQARGAKTADEFEHNRT